MRRGTIAAAWVEAQEHHRQAFDGFDVFIAVFTAIGPIPLSGGKRRQPVAFIHFRVPKFVVSVFRPYVFQFQFFDPLS